MNKSIFYLVMFFLLMGLMVFSAFACGDDDDDDDGEDDDFNPGDDDDDDSADNDDSDDDDTDDDDDVTPYFEIDFDNYVAGPLDEQNGWSAWGQDGGEVNVVALGKGAKAMQITGYGGGYMLSAGYNFDAITDDFYFEFAMLLTGESGYQFTLYGDNPSYGDDSAIRINVDDWGIDGGQDGDGEWVSCYPDLADNWHVLGIAADMTNQTYKIYIDGSLTECVDISFSVPGFSAINGLGFYASSAYSDSNDLMFDTIMAKPQ